MLNDAKRYVHSPAVRSGSRLVARMRMRGQPAKMASATVAACAITCSQLSKINSSCLAFRKATSASSSGRLCASGARTAAAIAATTASLSTGASPTKQTAQSPAALAPTWSAVCVFPIPPVPVSVTRRCSRTSVAISSSSASRPTKLVNASGSARGVGVMARYARTSGSLKLAPLLAAQRKRGGQHGQCLPLRRPAVPALERADSVAAHPRKLRERLLRERCGQPVLAQQRPKIG